MRIHFSAVAPFRLDPRDERNDKDVYELIGEDRGIKGE